MNNKKIEYVNVSNKKKRDKNKHKKSVINNMDNYLITNEIFVKINKIIKNNRNQ